MKFIPHDYQNFAIEHIKNNKISALFLDMGLGRKNSNDLKCHKRFDV
ncbi:hypothetical protein V425_04145 [Lactococcus lactis RTB018]|nr:hypothetical protein V425_04145 [Lactococcus lactis RTB018]